MIYTSVRWVVEFHTHEYKISLGLKEISVFCELTLRGVYKNWTKFVKIKLAKDVKNRKQIFLILRIKIVALKAIHKI